MLLAVLILATLFLAYSNGANDNFKGVATLYGTRTTTFGRSLTWATITTFAGSIACIFLAAELVKYFSGKGLVPDVVASQPEFLLAVGLGAGFTVMLATLIGFPISTTHSLTGALLGSGFMAVGFDVNFAQLGQKFVIPLLISPLLAAVLAALLYVAFRWLRLKMRVDKAWCVCIGEKTTFVPIPHGNAGLALSQEVRLQVQAAEESTCTQAYTGKVWGVNAQSVLDRAHYLSAGAVSFARGLNDTPKIVALLVVLEGLDVQWSLLLVGVAMALGGILNSRRVAETMSDKITDMNTGQGFTANLVTSFLVIVASRFAIPVSTTHVSCGALFGIGGATGQGHGRKILEILFAWVLTLPVGALSAAASYAFLTRMRG